MIRHIVSWKLAAKEEPAKAEGYQAIAGALLPLAQVIPEILAIGVERNIAYPESNWDVVLVADFETLEDLESYQRHPDHVAATAVVRSQVAERVAVDIRL